MKTCGICGQEQDCRPYGKDAAWICVNCMLASPEREAEATRQIRMLMDIAETQCREDGCRFIVLTENGPKAASRVPDFPLDDVLKAENEGQQDQAQ